MANEPGVPVGVKILVGDSRDVLPTLPPSSVHCVVTSPPYFGLRQYGGGAAEVGHEDALDCLGWATGEKCGTCYLCSLLGVFGGRQGCDGVWRVLRDDSCCFVNLGDSYARTGSERRCGPNAQVGNTRSLQQTRQTRPAPGLKSKDLCLMPHRFALAMQAAGWYVRNDIVWHKPSPMPESVGDRCTRAHEYVFHLTKRESYFYDAEAIREAASGGGGERNGAGRQDGPSASGQPHVYSQRVEPGSRNKRSVWSVPTRPCKELHFAIMPQSQVLPCIRAGTSERGACAACGSQYVRVLEQRQTFHDAETTSAYLKGSTSNRLALLRQSARARGEEYSSRRETVGWKKSCGCETDLTRPAVVLDPFAGAGTTGVVAAREGRDFVGIELNPEYADLALRRASSETSSLFGGNQEAS